MLPKWHMLIGFIFSYILIYFFNFSLLAGVIIFLSSWLFIDLDHYFYYIYKKKDWSFFKFYYSSLKEHEIYRQSSLEERSKAPKKLFVFHGIEFWLILIILSFFNRIALWILLGFAIHMLADWAELFYIKEPFYLKLSQTYTHIKNKEKFKSNSLTNI